MLAQAADTFSQNKDDIGCIPDLKVTIKLNDETPVKKNYIYNTAKTTISG
jgi:hypothetical protein